MSPLPGLLFFSRSRSHGLAAVAAYAVGYFIPPLPGLKQKTYNDATVSIFIYVHRRIPIYAYFTGALA